MSTLAIFTNYPRHLCELPWPFLRITLVICANYHRHLYELPSPFVRITLAIFANYPRHPDNNVLNHPRLYIELPSPFDLFSRPDYRNTRPRILKIMYHTSGGIIPLNKVDLCLKKIRLEMIWNQYQNNPMYVLGIDIPVSILFLSMV